jgi:hypothetical protein
MRKAKKLTTEHTENAEGITENRNQRAILGRLRYPGSEIAIEKLARGRAVSLFYEMFLYL